VRPNNKQKEGKESGEEEKMLTWTDLAWVAFDEIFIRAKYLTTKQLVDEKHTQRRVLFNPEENWVFSRWALTLYRTWTAEPNKNNQKKKGRKWGMDKSIQTNLRISCGWVRDHKRGKES
jgi:hypothetical protein